MSRIFDPTYAYVTSPVLPPLALACVRLTFGFYAMFTLIYSLAYGRDPGFFSYFTHLTYTGMCAWFWASGVQGIVWVQTGKKGGDGRYMLRSWPRALQWAHEWLWSTIFSYPILVTIVYWSLLAPTFCACTPVDTWSSVSMHAINSAFCLFEVLLTNNPLPRWIWLAADIVVLAMYLGLAYLSDYTLGYYVYPFLNPSKEGAFLAAYIVGIGAGEAIIYCIMYGVLWLRLRITRSNSEEGVVEGDSFESELSVMKEKGSITPASP